MLPCSSGSLLWKSRRSVRSWLASAAGSKMRRFNSIVSSLTRISRKRCSVATTQCSAKSSQVQSRNLKRRFVDRAPRRLAPRGLRRAAACQESSRWCIERDQQRYSTDIQSSGSAIVIMWRMAPPSGARRCHSTQCRRRAHPLKAASPVSLGSSKSALTAASHYIAFQIQ
jgi:hypothetical protein